MPLPYHQPVYELLGLDVVPDPEAHALVDAWERHRGLQMPAALRELWCSRATGTRASGAPWEATLRDVWFAYSNDDAIPGIQELLEQQPGQPEHLLRIWHENQAGSWIDALVGEGHDPLCLEQYEIHADDLEDPVIAEEAGAWQALVGSSAEGVGTYGIARRAAFSQIVLETVSGCLAYGRDPIEDRGPLGSWRYIDDPPVPPASDLALAARTPLVPPSVDWLIEHLGEPVRRERPDLHDLDAPPLLELTLGGGWICLTTESLEPTSLATWAVRPIDNGQRATLRNLEAAGLLPEGLHAPIEAARASFEGWVQLTPRVSR